MSTSLSTSTSISLLDRVRKAETDESSWSDFVNRYGPQIYRWCLNRKLRSSDAEDITQSIMINLVQQMRQFQYDSRLSFRGWLRRITENAVNDFFREQKRKNIAPVGGSGITQLLDSAEAPRELADRLSDVFDLELMEEALTRVSARVSDKRWQAWHLSARKGYSGAEVAAELDMKIATVYTSRGQIQQLIQEEIQRLETSE